MFGAAGPDPALTRAADSAGSADAGPTGASPARPPRALVAYHEAGHAAIGHGQGLTFGVIYLGDASGQVLFDEQWEAEEVVRDAALLDRYGLMLLAGAYAEQRYADRVLGAQEDVDTLRRMVREARRRGTEPRADLWRRAEQQVDEHWPAIEALADELVRRSAPVGDLAEVLAAYPHLGRDVDHTTGPRARQILDRFGASRPVLDRPALAPAAAPGMTECS